MKFSRLVPIISIFIASCHGGFNSKFFLHKKEETGCGYEACHPPLPGEDIINVHLVPHSHDDLGYRKTVEEYFYGDSQHYQRAGVQYIFESTFKELAMDPEKR